jgi:hypothetical protein
MADVQPGRNGSAKVLVAVASRPVGRTARSGNPSKCDGAPTRFSQVAKTAGNVPAAE